MNNFIILASIQMSESDKRALIILIIVLFVFFFLLGLLGMGIRAAMSYQAKRADTFMHDVTVTHVVTSPSEFRKLGRKKNNRLFYRQAMWPFLIMFVGLLVWIIYSWIAGSWSENIFVSFSDLLFTWDWADEGSYTNFFFFNHILKQWPPLLNTPHFEVNHIASYFEVPLLVIGGVWYLVICQAYFSRAIQLQKRSRDVFSKSLEGYKANEVDPSKVPPLPPSD